MRLFRAFCEAAVCIFLTHHSYRNFSAVLNTDNCRFRGEQLNSNPVLNPNCRNNIERS